MAVGRCLALQVHLNEEEWMKLTLMAALMFAFAFTVIGCEKKADAGSDAAATADKPAGDAAPAAAAGGGCDKYQKCCDAMSKMEGMSAMASACANIATLKDSPNGNDACNEALKALASVPNIPADCK
jgi:hypothetical protein